MFWLLSTLLFILSPSFWVMIVLISPINVGFSVQMRSNPYSYQDKPRLKSGLELMNASIDLEQRLSEVSGCWDCCLNFVGSVHMYVWCALSCIHICAIFKCMCVRPHVLMYLSFFCAFMWCVCVFFLGGDSDIFIEALHPLWHFLYVGYIGNIALFNSTRRSWCRNRSCSKQGFVWRGQQLWQGNDNIPWYVAWSPLWGAWR